VSVDAHSQASSVLGGSVDPAAAYRRQLDTAAGTGGTAKVNAEGNVKVEVAPAQSSRPLSDSLFSKTPMQRDRQMQPASRGPQEPAHPGGLQGW
jgi:hypothetical protein